MISARAKRENTLSEKKQIILASGAFDLVHYGHVRFLEEAKKAGGKNVHLIVIVARDKTIEKMKGKAPVIPEDQRRAVVESLKPVDEAFLGYENLNFIDVIHKICTQDRINLNNINIRSIYIFFTQILTGIIKECRKLSP